MRYFLQEHYTGQIPKLYGPYQKKEYAVDKLLTLLSEKGDLSKEELQERYAEGSMVGQILKECFTGEDFLAKSKGNIKLAEELFNFVSFQSPKLEFIFEYLDEDEFEKKFGEPIKKFL